MLRLRRQPKGRAGRYHTIRPSDEGYLDAKHTILASMEVTLLEHADSQGELFRPQCHHHPHWQKVGDEKEAVTRRRITGQLIKGITSR